MSLVNFKQGTQSSIEETPVSDGTIYFATDSKEILVDIPDGERTTFSQVIDHQEITEEEIDEIFAKYQFVQGEGGGSVDFPITVAQGGTGATDKETAWENLGGGSVGKISLPDVAENKYLADDGTWKEVQSSSVDDEQFEEVQEQITSVEQLVTETGQKVEEINTNVNRLDNDMTEVQQSITSINETLENKLDASEFTKEKLLELIGVFQGATATQDGEPGLVPAAPME